MSATTMTNSAMSDQERIKRLEDLYMMQTAKIDELTKIVTELRSAPPSSDPIKATPKKPRTHCKCGSTEHKNISHKDCPMNKLNNPFAEASDEPKPAPKKRGRPKKVDKEVVSTSEENPIDEMLSNLTLNETDSQETVINEDAFPSPNSEPEAKKQTRDEQMMDLFGEPESPIDDLAKEVAELEEDKEKAKEIEKAAQKAEAKRLKEIEKAEAKRLKEEAKEIEKAAKKAEAKRLKEETAEIEKAQKAKEKAQKAATIAEKEERDEADKKKVAEQLDTITKILQHPEEKPDTEMDVDKQFEELMGSDDEEEAVLSDLDLESDDEDEDVDMNQTKAETLD